MPWYAGPDAAANISKRSKSGRYANQVNCDFRFKMFSDRTPVFVALLDALRAARYDRAIPSWRYLRGSKPEYRLSSPTMGNSNLPSRSNPSFSNSKMKSI